MKLRFFAAAVVLAMTAIAAHAQAGIYVNPIGTHITNSVADTGPFAFLGSGAREQNFYGVSMGGYYEFFQQGKLRAGIDVRDVLMHGNNASLNAFLVGARVSGSPFTKPFKPYAQLSVGAGTTRPPTNNLRITRFFPNFTVGCDYTLNHRFDWRIIEIGYGSLSTISSGSVSASPVPIPNSRLVGFSTGFVIKF